MKGRDPFSLAGKVLVSRAWYDRVLAMFEGRGGCPFCGSQREPVVNKAHGFKPRKGCLDCCAWWSPCELAKARP